jgi:hypothetical protein
MVTLSWEEWLSRLRVPDDQLVDGLARALYMTQCGGLLHGGRTPAKLPATGVGPGPANTDLDRALSVKPRRRSTPLQKGQLEPFTPLPTVLLVFHRWWIEPPPRARVIFVDMQAASSC